MSVIANIIPPQSFEIVRDRIGRILADELTNQFQMSGNKVVKVKNFIERVVAFDNTELPAVNVSFAEDSFVWNTAIQSTGTARYYIDVYGNAPSSANGVRGDALAMTNLQRLMGVIRSILMDARYKTLGFDVRPGFIAHRHIESIQVQNPNQKRDDSESTVMGRLIMQVVMPETTEYTVPRNASGFLTQVKLADTGKGYEWVVGNTLVYDAWDSSFDASFF